MSLNGALQIGRSALTASQAAIQVAGNNMANAGTVGFHRQSVHLTPARGEILGRNTQVGTGVQLLAVRREVDTALQSRHRDAISQHGRDPIDQRFLGALEAVRNDLSDNDLSSLLSQFFNSFSELANNPEDNAVRSVVIQQGRSLATRVSSLRDDYNVMLQEVDRTLGASVEKANDILTQVAQINGQIANIENAGGGQASSLRDQRDILVDELSHYVDVTVIEPAGSGGAVHIFVGSEPILLGTTSRGIELRTESVDGQTEVSMRVAADGTKILANSGSIGGLLKQREQTIRPAIEELNTFTGQLIFQVNRVHSQGQGRSGFSAVAGTYSIADTAANLNSVAADLPFDVQNGSFFIHVTHAGTGVRTTHQINVDGDSMSLNDLVTQINTTVGVPNVTAGINANRQLTLTANSGYEISFSDDSSGALAALGVNTFFTGSDAADIDVNQRLLSDPNMLAAGGGHVAGSNITALTMADLQNVKLPELNNQSLREYWQLSINALAVKADAANTAVESSGLVKDSLNAQIQSVSGVSLDEESINLLTYQRQFQAAARFISVIDEAMQTLLSIA
jgi:flagellar hook-associated protein 1